MKKHASSEWGLFLLADVTIDVIFYKNTQTPSISVISWLSQRRTFGSVISPEFDLVSSRVAFQLKHGR